MSAKHTPPPWASPTAYPSEVEREDGKTIASCWHEQAVDKTINLVGVADCSIEESVANARLIAAAAELLEAAKQLLAIVTLQNGNKHDDINKIQDDARAAIAKAEGGQ